MQATRRHFFKVLGAVAAAAVLPSVAESGPKQSGHLQVEVNGRKCYIPVYGEMTPRERMMDEIAYADPIETPLHRTFDVYETNYGKVWVPEHRYSSPAL